MLPLNTLARSCLFYCFEYVLVLFSSKCWLILTVTDSPCRSKWIEEIADCFSYLLLVRHKIVKSKGFHLITLFSYLVWMIGNTGCCYNCSHNIMRIFDVLPKWNEAWLLVINLYKRVASRVAKRLKT